MRESFIIYKSFFEAGEQIRNKVDRLLFYEAIFKFALFQEECELSGVAKGMFVLVKPQLEANLRKFENGKKPKQNRSKVEANDKQNGSKTEGNVNDNVNVNENDNDECKNTPISTSPSTFLSDPTKPAISIPNLRAIEERTCSGSRYSPSISDDLSTSSVKVPSKASFFRSNPKDSIFPIILPWRFLASLNKFINSSLFHVKSGQVSF